MKTFNFNYSFEADKDKSFYLENDFPVEQHSNTQVVFSDDIPWDTVLDSFLEFLGGVYGYNIKEQVRVMDFEERLEMVKERYGFKDKAEDDEDDEQQ